MSRGILHCSLILEPLLALRQGRHCQLCCCWARWRLGLTRCRTEMSVRCAAEYCGVLRAAQLSSSIRAWRVRSPAAENSGLGRCDRVWAIAADRDGDRRAPQRHHPRVGHHAAALHHARADDSPDHRQGVRTKPCAGRVTAAWPPRAVAGALPLVYEQRDQSALRLLSATRTGAPRHWICTRARAHCAFVVHARMSCARPCVLRMCPCMDACMHA